MPKCQKQKINQFEFSTLPEKLLNPKAPVGHQVNHIHPRSGRIFHHTIKKSLDHFLASQDATLLYLNYWLAMKKDQLNQYSKDCRSQLKHSLGWRKRSIVRIVVDKVTHTSSTDGTNSPKQRLRTPKFPTGVDFRSGQDAWVTNFFHAIMIRWMSGPLSKSSLCA